MPVARIEDAIGDIRQGKMVILVDDEDRENEGDLTLAAEHVTPEAIAFMATHGRGLICCSLTEERVNEAAGLIARQTRREDLLLRLAVDRREQRRGQ